MYLTWQKYGTGVLVFKLEPINCICKALVENDESIRRTDDVFTGRDNGKRRMSSFHSSVSLDVTLHLFISSLNAGSKGGWGGSKDLELEISSDTKYRTYLSHQMH